MIALLDVIRRTRAMLPLSSRISVTLRARPAGARASWLLLISMISILHSKGGHAMKKNTLYPIP